MWLDGMIIVIFAEQYIIEPDIYLAFYAPMKGGLYFESGTLIFHISPLIWIWIYHKIIFELILTSHYFQRTYLLFLKKK